MDERSVIFTLSGAWRRKGEKKKHEEKRRRKGKRKIRNLKNRFGSRPTTRYGILLCFAFSLPPFFPSFSSSPFHSPGPTRERKAAWHQSPSTRSCKSRCFPWQRSEISEKERRDGEKKGEGWGKKGGGWSCVRCINTQPPLFSFLAHPTLFFCTPNIQVRRNGRGKDGGMYLCPLLPVLRPDICNRHAHPVEQCLRLEERQERVSLRAFL